MQCVNWSVLPVSTLQQAIIRRSIMVIRYIGRMVHRSHRLMIQELWHEVKAVTDYATVKTMDKSDAVAAGIVRADRCCYRRSNILKS